MPGYVAPIPETPNVPKDYSLPSFGTQSPTTSGFSSGAFLSAFLNVIYSATFKGYGATGGGDYWFDPASFEDDGLVDPISNLKDKRIIIHHGQYDDIVPVTAAIKNAEFWRNKVGLSDDQLNDDYVGINNGHTYPSAFYYYFVENLENSYPNYDFSVSVICWLYPDLGCQDSGIPSRGGSAFNVIEKAGYTGTLKTFSQEEFCVKYAKQSCLDIYMSSEGHYYVPKKCEDPNSNCKLHFVLHGCGLTAMNYGTGYMRTLTMFELADKFGIVLIMPSAHNYDNGGTLYGCWNTNGYVGLGLNYMTKDNLQFQVMKAFADRLMAQHNYVPNSNFLAH